MSNNFKKQKTKEPQIQFLNIQKSFIIIVRYRENCLCGLAVIFFK